MKKLVLLLFYVLFLGSVDTVLLAESSPENFQNETIQQDTTITDSSQDETILHKENQKAHTTAPAWTVIPHVVLLLMIATGPLFYDHFWHKNYPKIAVILAIIVVGYYLFVLHNFHGPVHALFEYFQFIALLASLYVASGGIKIDVDKKSTPLTNSLLLLAGAVISN